MIAGRFTARGGAAVEARIGAMMTEIADTLSEAIVPEEYRAVVLLGGYGRGEGGADAEGGEERPHNNFDFLIITRSSGSPANVKTRVDRALAPLVARWGIGMDVGAISDLALHRAPCLVMWYDMRAGHKVLLGDASFVASLDRFRLERIPSWDVRNLLVNRGTLLVINDLLLERGCLDDLARRTIVKHAVKAVLGYGDALLFFLGGYHWSYIEKQRRMRAHMDVPESFRRLYDEAAEFRFQPRYAAYLGRDLAGWNRELRRILAPVHLECERRRLGDSGLSWDGYAEAAFARALTDGVAEPRVLAKKLLGLVQSRGGPSLRGWRARVGYRTCRLRERMPMLFPAVAYDVEVPDLRTLAGATLGAHSGRPAALRHAYLRAWTIHGDPNSPALFRTLNLCLDDGVTM